MFLNLTEYTLLCLRAHGWTEDRHIDITASKQRLHEFGWELFPLAETFLQSFDQLPDLHFPVPNQIEYKCSVNTIMLRATCGADWQSRNSARIVEVLYKTKLYPIGHQDLFDLFIDESGGIYGIDADYYLVFYGAGLEKSLHNLFTGRTMEDFNLHRLLGPDLVIPERVHAELEVASKAFSSAWQAQYGSEGIKHVGTQVNPKEQTQ